MRQAAPEIDGARVERDRRCLNGPLERATIWNEDKWISSNASVFVHCIYSCAIMLHFCSRNCNGLKEESAGKTAEVAFFLLYRKQLEIAGIGIKHIRACSLDVFLLGSDFLIPQGCLKCNKEANRTENKFCARLPSMTQVHGPKKETCFWPGPKRWYQYQYIHMYVSKTWQILLTTLCPACSWSGLESVPASGTAVRHVSGFPASNSCRNHSLSPKRRPTRSKSKNEISDSFMSFTIFALCPFLLLNSVGFLLISFLACYSCSSCCFSWHC